MIVGCCGLQWRTGVEEEMSVPWELRMAISRGLVGGTRRSF